MVVHKVVAAALWTYLIVLLPEGCCVHALGDQQRPAAPLARGTADRASSLSMPDHVLRPRPRDGEGGATRRLLLPWH